MSDMLTQAHALKRVLGAVPSEKFDPALGESLLTCARLLLDQGEAQLALELIDAGKSLREVLGPEWGLRLEALGARALCLAEAYDSCIKSARLALAEARCRHLSHRESIALLETYEAASLWRLHRIEEARVILERLRRQLLDEADSPALACCTVHLSSVLLAAGDYERATELATDALVSARRARDRYWEALALLQRAVLEKHLARWQASEDSARSSVEVLRQLGNSYQLSHALLVLGIVLWKRGRLAEASKTAHEAEELASRVGQSIRVGYAHAMQSLTALAAGDFDKARVASRLAMPQAPDSRLALIVGEYGGDTRLESGEIGLALEAYDEVWPKAFALVPRGDIVAELRRRRAECYLLLGKHERALHEAQEAIAHCVEISDRYEESATYRILALSLAALGRHDEARSAFDKGFACYEDIETPYEWGKLWMSYGDWICGEHAGAYRDLNGAHEAYRNASAYFENMGAAFKLEQARKRLNDLEELMRKEGALPSQQTQARLKPLRRPREIADLHRRGQWIYEQFGLVTRSKVMIDMLEEVSRIAASGLPVLVLGESGTGKELVAHGVHKLSGRRGRFVPVNASALPDALVEGELFGHMQGAFTNATREKEGLFEYANGGTIFLDEIGEMSVDLQAKLLRVLESGEIRRVGGTNSIHVDVRVVAATNRDRAAMESGEGFRSDLYYRLSHAMIELPPLRQRGEDIEFLVEHFLDEFCARYRKRVSVSPEAMGRLVGNFWPGNVRQLRATMERLIVSARSVHTLMPREVPAPASANVARPASLEEELLQKERQRIVEALEKTRWVKADAARLLRMSRTTLIAKMKRMGVEG